MALMNPGGKKISVWCADCKEFVIPNYEKRQNMTAHDGYVCPKCGRLIALVEK